MNIFKNPLNPESLKNIVFNHNLYLRLYDWANSFYFSKKRNITLLELLKEFIAEVKRNDISTESRAVSYSFILAIFPSIIFLFTLIPLLVPFIPNAPETLSNEQIIEYLSETLQLPTSISAAIGSTVDDIINTKRNDLTIFTFLMALTLSTNGTIALMDSFNKCYKATEQRGFFKKRLIATGLTLLLAFVLFTAIMLLVIAPAIIKAIFTYGQELIQIDLALYEIIDQIDLINHGVFLLIFFFTISIFYYYAPVTHSRWSFFSLGAFVATFLCIITTVGFSMYITNFDSYNKLYGSIGALIGIMIWINLITLMFLIGFEVNTAIDNIERKKSSNKE